MTTFSLLASRRAVTEGVAKPSLFQPNKERVGKTMPEAEVAPQPNGAAEANGAKGSEGEAPDTFGKQVGIIVPPPDIKVPFPSRV